MPFNLRGGRPKNMGQGIYWVQREVASGRKRSMSRDAVNRFNERFNRITDNLIGVVEDVTGPNGEFRTSGTQKQISAYDEFVELRAWINHNIDIATQGDLSKLATAAKNSLIAIAKAQGWGFAWDAKAKILCIDETELWFG